MRMNCENDAGLLWHAMSSGIQLVAFGEHYSPTKHHKLNAFKTPLTIYQMTWYIMPEDLHF
jgi:hypothetical protein